MTRPSIFEFAGGEAAFLALAAATHEHCLACFLQGAADAGLPQY